MHRTGYNGLTHGHTVGCGLHFHIREMIIMTYETKAILQALADIACRVDTAEDVYKSIQRMAGVEGLVLKPYEEAKKELA